MEASGSKPRQELFLQGYRDPHLPLLTRDSPVLSKACFILIVQWAASNQVSLYNADCKSAFLQGLPDDERPTAIYMRPPQDGIALEINPKWQSLRYVYKLTAPVYGQANAPRRWFLYVVQVLTGKHWAQHLGPVLLSSTCRRSGCGTVGFACRRHHHMLPARI